MQVSFNPVNRILEHPKAVIDHYILINHKVMKERYPPEIYCPVLASG